MNISVLLMMTGKRFWREEQHKRGCIEKNLACLRFVCYGCPKRFHIQASWSFTPLLGYRCDFITDSDFGCFGSLGAV